VSRARARSAADSGLRTETESAAHVSAERWERAAPYALFALACLVYLNTLANGFTLDDVPLVRESALVTQPGTWSSIFRSHYWAGAPTVGDHGLYRPVTIASYALVHALGGGGALSQHAVNVLLHGLATVLLFAWIRPLVKPLLAAITIAALFAVHPIHTEAVSGIVGRAELLAFVGVAGCVCALERARLASNRARASSWIAVALGAFALALLSKETGVLAPALALWTEIVFPERRWLLRRVPRAIVAFALLALVFAVIWYVRSTIVGARWVHPGWEGVGALDRTWTALRVLGEYAILLVWPARLLAEYGVHDVPIAHGLGHPGVVFALVSCLALAALAWFARERAPLITWGLGTCALALVLVSNLLVPIGVMKAERLLYLPSAGFLAAVVAAALPLATRARTRGFVCAAGAIALAACSARTWVRNGDWHDNRTIALSIEGVSPNSPVLQTNLAIWERENGRNDRARAALLEVLAAEPSNARTLAFLGDVESDLGELASARARYEAALRLAPGEATLHMKLARTLLALGEWRGAAAELEGLRATAPDEPAVWLNLLVVYRELGETALAVECARAATLRFPRDARVWMEAASAFESAGSREEAARARTRARELGPLR
jgi:hypothetical protein